MASQPNSTIKSSRWGSFLTGLESKLDTILADEDPSKTPNKGTSKTQDQPSKTEALAMPLTPSRTPSANRAQDRLNEKMAKALANRALGKRDDASATSFAMQSRSSSPGNATASPRPSTELQREEKTEEDEKDDQEKTLAEPGLVNGTEVESKDKEEVPITPAVAAEHAGQSPVITVQEPKDDTIVPRVSSDLRSSSSTRQSFEITRSITPNVSNSPKINGIDESGLKSSEELERMTEQLQSDNEAAELRRQEETHEYLERIDALQAKLQYLTKAAREVAKTASSEAKPGSAEQKLAAKDERIALLIEEGQNLSQTELRHMNIIKKLRAKSLEDEKTAEDNKKISERQERMAREAQDRARRAEAGEKRAFERLKAVPRIEKDLESIRVEQDAKDALIRDLQLQLSEATSFAKEAQGKANAEALEVEKRRAAVLADELSNVKTERSLAEKQYQTELMELRGKSEREKERARIAEVERQGEQSVLESRLEAYRARAEEASAGQGGDAQAKLLRQIETLQNQYEVARENWQGIEGSLLSKLTVQESERDEIAKREADIRRKARETNIKSRRREDDIEKINAKMSELDHELSCRTTQLSSLQEKLSKSEADVAAVRNDIKIEREAWESRLALRLEEEKANIKEELVRSSSEGLYEHFRNESPAFNRTRKSSNAERASPHSRRMNCFHGLAITGTSHSSVDRPLSRRSSNPRMASHQEFQLEGPLSRQDSTNTVPQVSVNGSIAETPSVADKDDDFFDGVHTPATPERTINDLISTSTAGAGPSVQLVERMSAAVRRLESEKASHKDELSRLSVQRDEAREQVVELMQDNEGKRKSDERVKALEEEVKSINERYLTTLEMLGEKSERAEELKADIVDLKSMYRELVESAMK